MNSISVINEKRLSLDSPAVDLLATIFLFLVVGISVLLPDSMYNIRSGSLNISPLNLLMPAMAAISGIYVFLRRHLLTLNLTDAAVLAFMAYLLLRNIFIPGGDVAIKFAVFALGAFYSTALISRQQKYLNSLVYLIVGIACATLIPAFVEYAVQKNFIYPGLVLQPTNEIHRVGSTLGHPVIFGAFLAQVLPFCIFVWIGKQRLRNIILGITASVWAIMALFLTYSKGSWIAVTLLMIIFILISVFNRYIKIFIPVISIFLFLLVTLGIFWNQTYMELSQRADLSVNIRSTIWSNSFDAIEHNALLGVGIRNGPGELLKYTDSRWLQRLPLPNPSVDNSYLSICLEEGIAGLSLWLLAMGSIIYRSIKSVIAYRGASRAWMIAALTSLLAISINAFTFNALLMWPTFMLFWVAAGMLRGAMEIGKDRGTVTS